MFSTKKNIQYQTCTTINNPRIQFLPKMALIGKTRVRSGWKVKELDFLKVSRVNQTEQESPLEKNIPATETHFEFFSTQSVRLINSFYRFFVKKIINLKSTCWSEIHYDKVVFCAKFCNDRVLGKFLCPKWAELNHSV